MQINQLLSTVRSTVPQLVTAFALILNGLFLIYHGTIWLKLFSIYRQLGIPMAGVLSFLLLIVSFGLTVLCLAYFVYLKHKDQRGEKAKWSLLISLVLLLIPLALFIPFWFIYLLGIYNITGTLL